MTYYPPPNGAPQDYPGVQPGYQGAPQGYQGAPPDYQGVQPGYQEPTPTPQPPKQGLSGGIVALIAVGALVVGILVATVVVLVSRQSSPAPTSIVAAPPPASPSTSPSTSPSVTRSETPARTPTTSNQKSKPASASEVTKIAAAALTSNDRSAFVAVSVDERIGNGLFDLFRSHWGSDQYTPGKCTSSGATAKCQILAKYSDAGVIEIDLSGASPVIVDAVVTASD